MLQKIDHRYKTVKELGAGLSGEVWLVQDDEGQKALKFLKTIQLNVSKEEALKNFKNEFSLLSELNHPGIARILDFGFDTSFSRYYFTSEFINGADFFKATEGLPIEEIEQLAVQILRALNYLHSRGIYHLDIKPQNVLVQNNNGKQEAKIIDFGLAGLGSTGKLVGTPAYMAPEIIIGNQPDGRTDIYSFGVLLYKALTRHNPFASRNLNETLQLQQNATPKRPSEMNPQIPAYWDRILLRMLEKKPSNRYAQASFAIRDINFLASKKYDIETLDTRRSYLLDKGRVIGRRRETEIFRGLFEMIFREEQVAVPQLMIVEGKQGTGKSRLLSEFKYYSQLQAIPVFSWKQYQEAPPETAPFLLFIDEETNPSPDEINLLLQKVAGQKIFVVWATEQAPSGWSNCEKVILQNFTEHEVTEYLTAVTGLADPPQRLVQEIFDRTEGNPLFVTEILKTLLENNLILDSSGRWASSSFEDLHIDFNKVQVPTTLAELLKKKYLELPDEERKILEWMAVYNVPIGITELREVAKIEKPQGALLTLTREDLIERTAGGEGYFFKNLLLRDAVLPGLALSKKEALHDRIASHLEAKKDADEQRLVHRGYGSDNKQALSALLEMSDLCLKQQKTTQAVAFLKEASERAKKEDLYTQIEAELKLAEGFIRGREYKEAIHRYSHLKEVFEGHPGFEATAEQKIEICEKMGDLYIKLDAYDQALELFQNTLTSLQNESLDPIRLMIFENHLANAYWRKGEIEKAEKIFLKNDEKCENEFAMTEKKKILNNRLTDIFLLKGEYELALRQNEKDLDLFESIENDYLIARAYYTRGDIFYRIALRLTGAQKTETENKALESFERCIKSSKKIEAYDLLLRAYNGMGNIYFRVHNFAESLAYYQRGLAIARKLEDYQHAAVLALNVSNIYREEKNFQDAYSHLIYAINTLEGRPNKSSHNREHLFTCYMELAEICRETGDIKHAEESLNEAGALIRSNNYLSAYEFEISLGKAKLNLKKGEFDLCQEYYNKARNLAMEGEQMEELKKFEEQINREPSMSERLSQSQLRQPAPTVKQEARTDPSKEVSELEAILKINTMINSEHDPEHLLKMVLNYALELSGAESGLVLLLDENGEFSVKAAVNTSADQRLTKISTNVAKQALQTGNAVLVGDAISDDRFGESESVVIHSLKSILCLPIRSKNKAVGVFYLDNRFKINAFQNINQKLLIAFANQVGIALANAQLISGYQTAKKNLETKLVEREEELSTVKEQLKAETSAYITKYAYNQIISRSKPMREIFKMLDKVTETNLSICILGPSGTGKELIARALHYNNAARAAKRFVAINCGAIPVNLIESELFGYKAGSFTGAQRDKKGLFEEAHDGTLFLDEIGDLDMNLQVKLLRVLQEGEINRIGDTKPIKVDVRVICASHKQLEEMIKQGKFREDLYFRLCQLKINLPPLTERKEDIPLLVDHFVEKFRKENKIKEKIKPAAPFLQALLQYDWPGNVRELENLISVSCALREGEHLTLSSLPQNYRFVQELKKGATPLALVTGPANVQSIDSGKNVPIDENNIFDPRKTWNQWEAVIIAKCYQAHERKKVPAADMLGISHSTLYKKIKELDLDNPQNGIYSDPFVYKTGTLLKDYIPLVFKAALEFADGHPYAAIRQLGVSQGYFYKIIKTQKVNAA